MRNESRKLLWPDEETWLRFCQDAFCDDPSLAEQAARIWCVLLEHMSRGPVLWPRSQSGEMFRRANGSRDRT